MKLKSGIVYEYLREQDAYKFDFRGVFRQKIFARIFPILLGENQYQSIAYGVLKTLSCTQKEEIDPFYTIRGAVAEHFGYLHMVDFYEKQGVKNFKLKTYDDVQFDAYDNKYFGGKPDLKMYEPMQILHEIKSKDITKYENYEEDIAEIRQLEMYGVLENISKGCMVYVFPNNKVVEAIKGWLEKNKNDTSKFVVRDWAHQYGIFVDDFLFKKKFKTIDIEATKQLLNRAYKVVTECYNSGLIPHKYFYESDLSSSEGFEPF